MNYYSVLDSSLNVDNGRNAVNPDRELMTHDSGLSQFNYTKNQLESNFLHGSSTKVDELKKGTWTQVNYSNQKLKLNKNNKRQVSQIKTKPVKKTVKNKNKSQWLNSRDVLVDFSSKSEPESYLARGSNGETLSHVRAPEKRTPHKSNSHTHPGLYSYSHKSRNCRSDHQIAKFHSPAMEFMKNTNSNKFQGGTSNKKKYFNNNKNKNNIKKRCQSQKVNKFRKNYYRVTNPKMKYIKKVRNINNRLNQVIVKPYHVDLMKIKDVKEFTHRLQHIVTLLELIQKNSKNQNNRKQQKYTQNNRKRKGIEMKRQTNKFKATSTKNIPNQRELKLARIQAREDSVLEGTITSQRSKRINSSISVEQGSSTSHITGVVPRVRRRLGVHRFSVRDSSNMLPTATIQRNRTKRKRTTTPQSHNLDVNAIKIAPINTSRACVPVVQPVKANAQPRRKRNHEAYLPLKWTHSNRLNSGTTTPCIHMDDTKKKLPSLRILPVSKDGNNPARLGTNHQVTQRVLTIRRHLPVRLSSWWNRGLSNVPLQLQQLRSNPSLLVPIRKVDKEYQVLHQANTAGIVEGVVPDVVGVPASSNTRHTPVPAEITQTTTEEVNESINTSIEQLSPDNLPTLTSFLRSTSQVETSATESPGPKLVSKRPFNQFMSGFASTPSSIHASTTSTQSATKTAQKKENTGLFSPTIKLRQAFTSAFKQTKQEKGSKRQSKLNRELPTLLNQHQTSLKIP